MTLLTAKSGWDEVPLLDTDTKALGGAGGPMNAQAQALLNRTEHLADAHVVQEKIAVARYYLKRSISGCRPEAESSARKVVYTAFEAARKININGSISVWEPDGSGVYGAAWTRDMAMAMEGWLDYFSANEISAVVTYWLTKCNFQTYEVPDRIGHDGAVYWKPGPSPGWGSRAPIDGNMYLMQMAWLHYQATGSAGLYNTHKANLKNLIELGVSYNPISGCVNISNSSPCVGFGFYDIAILTGDVLFPSILAFRAFQQAADMESSLGNIAEAKRLLSRADEIRDGINSVFLVKRAGSGDELGHDYSARHMAYYTMATVKGAGQVDLWGTAFAVWAGITNDIDAKCISNYLLYVTTVNSDNFVTGGLRHVEKSSDYSPGSAVFQSTWVSPLEYGSYQNGGYWPTPLPWLLHSISLTQPRQAREHYDSFVKFQSSHGVKQPAEWWKADGTLSGPGKYLTSAIALLNMGGILVAPDAPSSAQVGGGDIVSNLLNTQVTITGGTILDSTAFGKMHVCSGTSTNYTITLPTASGNVGKVLGFRMANISQLSKRVTIDGYGSETIDDQSARVMWADESAILLCDGAQWKKIAGRTIPFTFRAYLSSNQPITANTPTKVQLNAVSPSLNTGGVFDPTTGRLNVPRQASWTFQGGINFSNGVSGGAAITQLNKNGANYQQLAFSHLSSTTNATITGTAFDNAAAQDYYELIGFISTSTNIAGVGYATFLSGQECYSW